MNSTKKTFSFMLIVFLFLSLSISSYANNDNVKLWLDGIFLKTDTAPIIEKGVTLVPIRVISESLGIETEWLKDSYIYHLPSGRYYEKTLVKNAVFFETEQEAINAGFRRAKR